MNENKHTRCIEDGATIAVVGAGPAGTFFAMMAQQEAEARGFKLRIVLLDGKSFLKEGPSGCNMCAGVISWNLLQEIEHLGMKIPEDRVQRLIQSYVFHTNVGSHSVIPPPGRGHIPVVYRGNGPRFLGETRRISFDDYLLEEALGQGAELIPSHVRSLDLPRGSDRLPRVVMDDQEMEADLVVVACGVSSKLAASIRGTGTRYVFPRCVRAYQAELDLGDENLEKYLGNNIHIFSLGIEDIRFAAMIPKSRFATVSLVGNKDLSHDHLVAFLQAPTVKKLLPPGWDLGSKYCTCRPRLPVRGARHFYGKRLMFIGDASLSRYYKNGIDSAFRTARYAVQAAFDHGIGKEDIRTSYYFLTRKAFLRENAYARLLFRVNDFVSTKRFWVRAHMDFATNRPTGKTAQTLHYLTWNLFTGDATYRDIFWTSVNPRFLGRMLFAGLLRRIIPWPGQHETQDPLHPAKLAAHPQPLGPLTSGSTVAIIGGGPGGTSCAIALKRMAADRNMQLNVVLYEGKVFENERHFNQCVGVLSPPIEEVLNHELGIDFPHHMVERSINAYRLCDRDQNLLLYSGTHRSYALRRCKWDSFMLDQTRAHGVRVVECRVTSLESTPDGVLIYAENGTLKADVVVGAFGLDPGTASVVEQWTAYERPKVMETILTNIHPEPEWMAQIRNEILAFLPQIPAVAFGAMTPKSNHLTVNIAGRNITTAHMERFLSLPEVRLRLPKDYDTRKVAEYCHKGRFPNQPAKGFFGDRFVAVGDAAGLVRPFKGKGVTSACVTGIAAAKVMMDYGISRRAFHAYRMACRSILSDRYYGWTMQRLADLFRVTGNVSALLRAGAEDPALRRAMFLSVSGEEPYRNVFRESLRAGPALRILMEIWRQWAPKRLR